MSDLDETQPELLAALAAVRPEWAMEEHPIVGMDDYTLGRGFANWHGNPLEHGQDPAGPLASFIRVDHFSVTDDGEYIPGSISIGEIGVRIDLNGTGDYRDFYRPGELEGLGRYLENVAADLFRAQVEGLSHG